MAYAGGTLAGCKPSIKNPQPFTGWGCLSCLYFSLVIYFVMVLKNIFQDVRNVRNVRFWYAIIILEKVEAGRFLTVKKSRPVLGAAFPFEVMPWIRARGGQRLYRFQ